MLKRTGHEEDFRRGTLAITQPGSTAPLTD